MSVFQERLKSAMDGLHLRQCDLVRKTGISRSVISSYLAGRYEAQGDKLQALADAMGINAHWFAGYGEIKEDENKEALMIFRSLDRDDKNTALAFLQFLRDKEQKERPKNDKGVQKDGRAEQS